MRPEECKYHTSDGGCRKSYIPCPSYTEEDGYDLGCGGVSFCSNSAACMELINKKAKEYAERKVKKNEENKKLSIRDK